MASAVELAKNSQDLEAQLFAASKYAGEFYEIRGWKVIHGDRKKVHTVQNGMIDGVCSDERFAYIGGVQPNILSKAGRVSLLGGIYLMMSEVTGGSITSVQRAREIGHRVGINLTRHGDEQHGDYGCAMFSLWANGQIPTKYAPNFGTEHIIAHAKTLGVSHHVLPHDHTAEIFTLNFIPGTAAKKTPRNFTHDFWASNILGIKDEAANEIIFATLSRLNDTKRQDEQIQAVEIIA